MSSNLQKLPDTIAARRIDDQKRTGTCMRFVSVFIFACAFYLILSPTCTWAAPFSKHFQFVQPDGTELTLWGEGDEFHAVFETTTGYTVVFDPDQKSYFYAKRGADGKSLISSGVLAHKPVPPDLDKHVRMDRDAVHAAAQERRKQWDKDTGLSKRWSQLKSRTLGTPLAPEASDALPAPPESTDESGVLPAPPESTTTGTKTGLTLLIDFSDAPATLSKSEIEAFLNSDSYTGFGNNGSVKKYFSDVSASRLSYTNVVTLYVRMNQPKSYYNDTSKDTGTQARLLINDALAILKARSDYNSTILPTFSALTTDDGTVVAFNVFFAGSNSGVWSKGLWPHSWGLASPVSLGTRSGKWVQPYQITNIGDSLELGTFCHENGHMICAFPDIYDYGYDSSGGAGNFCLMGYGGHGKNPVQVNAYLKFAAGWGSAIDLDSSSNLTGTLVAAPSSGYDQFYRFRRPGVATEYYLLENRQKTGRDSSIPAAGIAVWHVDELGDKDNQSLVPNSLHLNYELTLVQADNQWHFQKNVNKGDAWDLYYQGNTATAYANQVNDSSTPHAHWWDGGASGMNLNGFGVAGASMTFDVGDHLVAPILNAEPAVTLGTENTIYWSAVPALGNPVPTTEPSYNAECADNPDFSSPVNSGWIMQTSGTFQNLTPGQTYWYRVKAKSAEVESDWSNIVYSQQVDPDTDGDGIPDSIELILGTDPNKSDSDNDGIADGEEDANRNGIVDPGETDPRLLDTDGDGTGDGEEVTAGTDPLNNQSFPAQAGGDAPLMGPIGYAIWAMVLATSGVIRSRRRKEH